MKSTDITFSQIAEKRYLSDAIQVNSETIGLQLEFEESGKLAVYISYAILKILAPLLELSYLCER